jgi:eukaryotic-like serine/threonine-protein kinase
MAQCRAKTKDGNLCQITARDGQKYCHIHLRHRLWRRIISASAVGALLFGALSFVANVAGVLSFFGIVPYVNTHPTVTLTLTSTRVASPRATQSTIVAYPTVTPSPTATPTLGIGSTMVSNKDGMMYLYVPAGNFIMGSNKDFPDEKPEHTVYLDSYWVDQTEVTNAMYKLCVDAAACKLPSRTDYYSRDASSPDYPVVFVSWNDAKAYCEWKGARLPTEAEWEKVARGENGLIYPWGNRFECPLGNFDDETGEDEGVVIGGPYCDGYQYIAPVGSFPRGKSVYGALDMAGNLWEWVSDWYGNSYYYKYVKAPVRNPVGPELGDRRVVKGGAWLNDKDVYFRGSNRYSYPPELTDDNVGFRCVMPIK